jgi:DNA polymerase-3 subunit delta'
VSFEGIVGNRAAVERLRALAEGGRLAHAYLFCGPDGVGKKMSALAFAGALGARPRVVARPEDRHEILIAQVRELIRELSLTSRERRVVIFDEAERLSEEAMNALLKTLEEPPPRTVLILVTSVPERLLATIRSRCQPVFFHPLADDESFRHAKEGLGLSEEDAGIASLLSGGSPGAAIRLAEEIGPLKEAARGLQERVLAGELNPLVEALGRIRDTEQARRRAKRDLMILAHALRETLRSKSGYRPRLAGAAFVERMARLDDDALLERIETLLDHERAIELNANVALAVEDALLRI